MKHFSRILLFIFLSYLLSSCAPVYKVAHDYQPPASASGLSCIRGCQSQLNQCNNQCSVQFNQCSIKAEQQAKKLLPGLLQAYPQQLEIWLNARDQYQRDLSWYELRRDLAESRRERYLDHCLKEGKKEKSCRGSFGYRHHFSRNRPTFNISRPQKPSLATESAKLRQLSCSKECACDSKYRLCYTSCGGVVKSRKICIKNCGK